jgi:tripartite-type tricarboxylate transporter receptor subunit TctC
MWTRLLFTAILAHAGFSVWAADRPAETYPSKPIRLIVGPPGGSSDFIGRVAGPKLAERLGQTVLVDNRSAGAGGNIAAELLTRANPDGHTLMLALNPQLASSPSLYSNLGFDLMKDFSYVSLVATARMWCSVILRCRLNPSRS